MKGNNTLISIVSLFLVFSILGIFGLVLKISGYGTKDIENTNKEFHFNNKLYFYRKNGDLIGTYDCKTDNCNYAKTSVNDKDYSLKHFEESGSRPIGLINDRYAFLVDDTKDYIIFYDIQNKEIKSHLLAVKNYGIGLDGDYFFVKDTNNKWGTYKIDNTFAQSLGFNYEFLGVKNELNSNTNKLSVDKVVAKDNNGWMLISIDGKNKSSYYTNDIYDYNDNFVITKSDTYYFLYNLTGNLISNGDYLGMDFVNKYVKLLDSNKYFYIIDPDSGMEVSKRYFVNSIDDIEIKENLNSIELYNNNELLEEIIF